MIVKTHSTLDCDIYEVNPSTGISHYKETKEIVLIDFDSGEEFLLTDYNEAKEVCEFILSLIKEQSE